MTEKVFALTEADRAKLEAALLESQKALEGAMGALVDVKADGIKVGLLKAAAMAEEEAAVCQRYAATKLRAFALRLRTAAEKE